MSVDAVLDTNVLLYAASKDPADHAKAEIALPRRHPEFRSPPPEVL